MKDQQIQGIFNAQYINQTVLKLKSRPKETFMVLPYDCTNKISSDYYLILRSVSDLTDEELINVSVTSYNEPEEELEQEQHIRNGKYVIDQYHMGENYSISFYQYLLRIGILLPFTYINESGKPITLSPDEIIAKGWAKYQTS